MLSVAGTSVTSSEASLPRMASFCCTSGSRIIVVLIAALTQNKCATASIAYDAIAGMSADQHHVLAALSFGLPGGQGEYSTAMGSVSSGSAWYNLSMLFQA